MLRIFKGGYEVNLEDYGLDCLSFYVDSLSANHDSETVEGKDGEVDYGTTYNSRELHSRFLYRQESYVAFHENKDKVYKLFEPKAELTLIDTRLPHKRWTVKVDSDFTLNNEEALNWIEFDLDFISYSTYSIADEKTIKTHQGSSGNHSFIIFNDGDVELDPREYDLLITFKGASNQLRVVNEMNGTQWQYKKTTQADDVVTIDSLYSYKNNQSIFGDTTYEVITLEKGSNEITVYGAEDYSITFEFLARYV
jgi:hypothetical protein